MRHYCYYFRNYISYIKWLLLGTIFVYNQRLKYLAIITWVVVVLLVQYTLSIYFWGVFLGYTSGLNLAADLGPVLALLVEHLWMDSVN